jgi:hypothetical protein
MAIRLISLVAPVVSDREILCRLYYFSLLRRHQVELLIKKKKEALSRMLFATVHGGFLSGFSMDSRHSGVVNISHLPFVDDTLICCGA